MCSWRRFGCGGFACLFLAGWGEAVEGDFEELAIALADDDGVFLEADEACLNGFAVRAGPVEQG
jgi:hypothetical protein